MVLFTSRNSLCMCFRPKYELCFNIENKEQAERISEIMTTCVPNLNIPFEVDTALVDNWGEVE